MVHRKPYFFVGIGGSGMMPLAMILRGQGATVSGSDRSLDAGNVPAKFDDLARRGIALFAQDGSGVAAGQIIVASAAVEDTVADIVAARDAGCERMTRAELLATLFNAAPLSVGVAGTSGKSTVTGMIGWILHTAGRDPTVMNGAVMKNFTSPDAPFASALVGQGDAFVSEVDESDGSIALYRPSIAVLNNVSHDHKSMEELRTLFGGFLERGGHAVVNRDNAEAWALAQTLPAERVTGYGIGQVADLRADAVALAPFSTRFAISWRGEAQGNVSLQVPGLHNVSNALAAIGAAHAAGVPLADAIRAIEGFAGLKRRFERVGEAGGVVVIDDFGHNPEKIAATIDTLRAVPGRLLLMFQPHGYGPLRVMRHELVAMFAEKLGTEDLLVLPDPVYHGGTANREVGSADITADLLAAGVRAKHIPLRNAAAAALVAEAEPGDRIVLMGARDDTLSILATDIVAQLRA